MCSKHYSFFLSFCFWGAFSGFLGGNKAKLLKIYLLAAAVHQQQIKKKKHESSQHPVSPAEDWSNSFTLCAVVFKNASGFTEVLLTVVKACVRVTGQRTER